MNYKLLGHSIGFPKGYNFSLGIFSWLIEDPQNPRVANDYEFPEDERDPNWQPSSQKTSVKEEPKKSKEESLKEIFSGAKDFLNKI